jgi:hydrogenase nickel incorporation protein HypB
MCDSCGCGDPHVVPVDVHERILSVNERQAAHNREHFRRHGVLTVNLMGSPGAGKTAVLEATARAYGSRRRLAAITGDLATDRDAQRMRAVGVPAVSITTGSACHLDAEMVHKAVHGMTLDGLDVLFVENVGNLVCPAVYDLGQTANVVALSVTEGADKPLKYPVMFRTADLVLLTKVDLLPHLPEVRVEDIEEALGRVMPRPALLPLSTCDSTGVRAWLDWLDVELRALRPAESRAGIPA